MDVIIDRPVIPETITVHLGAPNEAAQNVTIPFADYIKNVASSEIYPTWPEAAIRANILAQISFALNRIYTEHYPSQGYDFDITNNTQYDQKYIHNRDVFENISQIVDEIFNNYVVRQGTIQPLFTSYCNGTTSTCDGLSQWGTVELANQGMGPYEILQYYFGDDIDIVFNAPVQGIERSYPGIPLRLGSAGEDVRIIQRQLNRISDNYPAIPKVLVDGFYGVETEEAVRTFQRIFNLTPDGIVGKATWYKIKRIYNGVKQLSELVSEGITIDEAQRVFPFELQEGDSGLPVQNVQYFLAVISFFDDRIPQVLITGEYDQNTVQGVRAFQELYGLPVTGVMNRETWNTVLQVYDDTIASIPPEVLINREEIYPGRYLTIGMQGEDVTQLQIFLQEAAARHSFIPPVEVTGNFDDATDAAVRAVQQEAGIPVSGAVGPPTWDRIVRLARNGGTA